MKTYEVKKKDSLWKIARHFEVTVDELAAANGLKGRQLHYIRIGQVLNIPDKDESSPDTLLSLEFRGLDFMPFTPKCVKVCCDGKEESYPISGNSPFILPVNDHASGLKIWIETFDKQHEKIFDVDTLPLGQWKLALDSRAVKSDGALQPKKGNAIESKAKVQQALTHNAQLDSGKTQQHQTRVEKGEPTHGIATIYTARNLRLVPGNERYRQLIIAAADKYGHTPQSLAAMINAEAAKGPGEAWIENSNADNPKAAQGLAQFFEAAWDAVFADEKSLLHKDCQAISKSARLAKRLEAKYAIDGAASLASINLDAFERTSGYSVAHLVTEDKAKMAYLLHHEGSLGTLRILGQRDQLPPGDLTRRLLKQLGGDSKKPEVVKNAIKNLNSLLERYDNDVAAAYKGWLFSYIDAHFCIQNFIVEDAKKFSDRPKTIEAILKDLKPSLQVAKPKPKTQPAKPASPRTGTSPDIAGKGASGGPMPAQQKSAGSDSTIDTTSHWHDPLAVCTLRTAKLSSKKGAMFGWTRNGGKKSHQGIDLAANPGTPIYAVADGIVYSKPAPNPKYDYGNTLILEVGINDLPPAQAAEFRRISPTARSIGFFYAHLSELPRSGTKVRCGQVIGKSGCSGNASNMTSIELGAHLHFEVRLDPKKTLPGMSNRADPLPFIEKCTNR